MKDFDLLIFDLDGVLVNTTSSHARAYGDLWRKLGVEGPPYERIAGRKTSEVVAEVTTEMKPSAAEIRGWVGFKQKQARKHMLTEEIVYGDSLPSLTALAREGVKLALGTGASLETTDIVLRRMGLSGFFSIVVTAEDVTEGKPSPECYQNIIARAAVSPGKALVLEDSSSGLAAALATGAYAASVRSGVTARHARFIGSFEDLTALLLNLRIGNRCDA
ncbi:MAG TPA: HAD family phosphatase [Blastocatellia bacterium]|nr:HAD family phosphatase [Blastocatellia bacterium]